MKLHEAISKLIEANGRPMTTKEIAKELNSNKWYEKKDGTAIKDFQIHGRTRNYTDLFKRNGTSVSLINGPHSVIEEKKENFAQPIKPPSSNISAIEHYFLDEKYFKSASIVDNLIPRDKCGLYCIRVNDIDALPISFKTNLIERKHNILYIGIANTCLNSRLLNQELRIKGHGTFIRSIGAILGFRPLKGSLVKKANKINYFFSEKDSQTIIKWINENLSVNWVEFSGDLEEIETYMIKAYRPLLNISKNPSAIPELKRLRNECAAIANS